MKLVWHLTYSHHEEKLVFWGLVVEDEPLLAEPSSDQTFVQMSSSPHERIKKNQLANENAIRSFLKETDVAYGVIREASILLPTNITSGISSGITTGLSSTVASGNSRLAQEAENEPHKEDTSENRADGPISGRLFPTTVTAAVIELSDAVQFFLELPSPSSPSSNLQSSAPHTSHHPSHHPSPHGGTHTSDSHFIYGDSLLFWQEVVKFMLDLLTRGCYLPSLTRYNSQFLARWIPLLSDTISQKRFNLLTSAMPTASRAAINPLTGQLPSETEAIMGFLSILTDNTVRSLLTKYNLAPSVKSIEMLVKRKVCLAWLSSLTSPSGVINADFANIAEFAMLFEQYAKEAPSLFEADSCCTPAIRICFVEEFADDMTVKNISDYNTSDPNRSEPSRFEPNNNVTMKCYVELGIALTGFKDRFFPIDRVFLRQLPGVDAAGYLPIESAFFSKLIETAKHLGAFGRFLALAFPSKVAVSDTEAYEMLRDSAKELTALGWIVHLPKIWKDRIRKVKLELHLDVTDAPDASSQQRFLSPYNSGLSDYQLVNFSWRFAIGDTALPEKEFFELVKNSPPLFKYNNTWVEIDKAELESLSKFVSTHKAKERLSLGDSLRLTADISSASDNVTISRTTGSGWLGELLAGRLPPVISIPQPEGFQGSLRPYQEQGLSWLVFCTRVGLGCCLADDMGLGKTIQLLALLLQQKDAELLNGRAEPLRFLLFAPMSIVSNWERECRQFTPALNVHLHHGNHRLLGNKFIERANESDLVISTYSLANRDEELFSAIAWRGMVLDEAQYIKNPYSKQTLAIKRLVKSADVLNDSFIQRIALTGTPLENHLDELWSILDFLNPKIMGSHDRFRKHFILPIEKHNSSEKSDQLRAAIRPFILRRLKTDPKVISDLPEKIEIEIDAYLTHEQAALYQSIVDDMLHNIDRTAGMHRKGLVLAMITKLKQVCDHPRLVSSAFANIMAASGKLLVLKEFLDVILQEGDKVLIFTQFAQFGHLLVDVLQSEFKEEVLFLHGGLTKDKRSYVVDEFQSNSSKRIFVLSLKAGGFGLNLTAANHVIHLDQWWNPATHQQATDRAFRIGQTRLVQVRRMICRGTLEERIHAMHRVKQNLADDIVSATRNEISKMSVTELKSLLDLSSSAIFSDGEQ